nr:MAG TPA: hypothetical protein [Caudoviricetes sp.]
MWRIKSVVVLTASSISVTDLSRKIKSWHTWHTHMC